MYCYLCILKGLFWFVLKLFSGYDFARNTPSYMRILLLVIIIIIPSQQILIIQNIIVVTQKGQSSAV